MVRARYEVLPSPAELYLLGKVYYRWRHNQEMKPVADIISTAAASDNLARGTSPLSELESWHSSHKIFKLTRAKQPKLPDHIKRTCQPGQETDYHRKHQGRLLELTFPWKKCIDKAKYSVLVKQGPRVRWKVPCELIEAGCGGLARLIV